MSKSIKSKLYLKNVFLSGYKSIENINIEFQDGINIIIGKNATGKTNFLTFLNKTLTLEYDGLNNFSSNLIFQNGNEISIKAKREPNLHGLFENSKNLLPQVDVELKVGKKTIKKGRNIFEKLINSDSLYDNLFLPHGIPNNYYIVDIPFSFTNESPAISSDLSKIIENKNSPNFLRNLSLYIIMETIFITSNGIILEQTIEKALKKIFKSIDKLSSVLKEFTPIEQIRFSENYNIYIDESKNSFTINNIFLEFLIDNNWHPFSSLSDGTKRLFYIISEVFDENPLEINVTKIGGFLRKENYERRIILIEEPELGIHPHQLSKLMAFFKIESEKKQIIITTHSPLVLDSISSNELERIIIAYSTNHGTELRHLNEEELTKAKEYINDDFLSDYWVYSDLEK